MASALQGIRILEVGGGPAAGYATRIMAGFGAEVIKVETPGSGDSTRRSPPFLDDVPGPERSGLALFLDTNKKSVTLDLSQTDGAAIFHKLARTAHLVIDSTGHGFLEDRGVGPGDLRAENPDLVVTAITPFGQSGPYAKWASSALIAYGMSVGGRVEDPVQIGGNLVHFLAGLHTAVAALVALYDQREGRPAQQVDVSIWEGTLMSAVYPAVAYAFSGVKKARGPLLGLLPCKDGYIGLNAYTVEQRRGLAEFLDMPELEANLGWSSATSGRDAPEELEKIKSRMIDRIKDRTPLELFEEGGRRRLPFGLAPTAADMLGFKQHNERNFFEESDHPVMGRIPLPGAPFKMTATPWKSERSAPALGEHNIEIFAGELGYSKAELALLAQRRVI